jgi:short subunit fatty acids transporter
LSRGDSLFGPLLRYDAEMATNAGSLSNKISLINSTGDLSTEIHHAAAIGHYIRLQQSIFDPFAIFCFSLLIKCNSKYFTCDTKVSGAAGLQEL